MSEEETEITLRAILDVIEKLAQKVQVLVGQVEIAVQRITKLEESK